MQCQKRSYFPTDSPTCTHACRHFSANPLHKEAVRADTSAQSQARCDPEISSTPSHCCALIFVCVYTHGLCLHGNQAIDKISRQWRGSGSWRSWMQPTWGSCCWISLRTRRTREWVKGRRTPGCSLWSRWNLWGSRWTSRSHRWGSTPDWMSH